MAGAPVSRLASAAMALCLVLGILRAFVSGAARGSVAQRPRAAQVSSAVGEQFDKGKASSPKAAEIIDGVSGTIEAVDKVSSIGSALSSAVTSSRSGIVSDVMNKAIESNEKDSITDKIKAGEQPLALGVEKKVVN